MYTRIIERARRTPWAITPEYLALIEDILRFRAAGGRLSAEELQARIEARGNGNRPTRRSPARLALIPIHGVLANRVFDATSGMTSVEALRSMFRRAVADEEVDGILLDVNSPGGAVPGIPELAGEIFEARAAKPIVAYVDDTAASAAYYLASQATEVIATPSSYLGSIGVYMLHISEKERLEKEGIRVTAIRYGERKLEGAPFEELDDETRAHLQREVDRLGREFEAAVARGRGVDVSRVRERFGQGRVFNSQEALSRGMVDRIGTFEDAVSRASVRGGRERRSSVRADQAHLALTLAQL